MEAVTKSTPVLLTVAEFADAVRISDRTAYSLVRAGDVPSVRLGRQVRIPRRYLDELLVAPE